MLSFWIELSRLIIGWNEHGSADNYTSGESHHEEPISCDTPMHHDDCDDLDRLQRRGEESGRNWRRTMGP